MSSRDKHENISKAHRLNEFFASNKKRIAFGLSAIVLAQNVDTMHDYISYRFFKGSMVPSVAGCEYQTPESELLPTITEPSPTPTTPATETETTPPTPTTTNPTEVAEKKAQKVRSSADNNSTFRSVLNIPSHIKQNSKAYDNLEHSFTSEHSGVVFNIYRTNEESMRTIDYDAFDDLFHLGFTTEIDHINPKIDFLMNCVSKQVLEEKVLAGTNIDIVIPSTNDYCISNLLLKKVDNRFKNDCTQSGAGLPKIELEALFFKPYSEQHFIVTAGDLNAVGEDLEYQYNKILMHEAMHRILYDLGVRPRKHPDEMFVKYLEDVVLNKHTPQVYGPPAPIGFAFSAPTSSHIEVNPDIPRAISFTTTND